MKVKDKAQPTLPPYWVSKMSPLLGLATLHSVKPPTEKGLPVATLINWLPDSDHFHSCLSDPVNDHISSLEVRVSREEKRWSHELVSASLDHPALGLEAVPDAV